ncbi:DEAD/DEAH box helicase [Hoyosella rhizosphaerae]|uniref:Helicase n=1 Tax=Hoyosella rhizosphaerae TaxID=1755582 RepID=A0A916UEP4_9ACTN|nr:DEAD/DEAH box helicase [Hoyosella rhizosphaerae]MBN4925554.1 DEAD/DEAH box helicase [Hoyosella rhizosphaerae]GGC69755.1 helicase [Hoyosella rhizosphaerae]
MTRATRTKRPTRRSRTVKPADIPTAGTGQRIWVLDVPFKAPAAGARYYAGIKSYAYVGATLPATLTVFASKPYSYQRWVEDNLNGTHSSGATASPKTPRVEQIDAAKAIARAAHAGWRGFFLADDPGLGKTGSAILGAKAALKILGGNTILITVDRPAAITIAAWRDSIAAFGDGGHRWLIISPDQLKKLLARNGQPKHHFDVIINDEAQQFRHLSAQRTQYQRRVAKLSAPAGKAPFVITLTATPGHHPGEYTYLSSLLAQIHQDPPAEWSNLGAKLVALGLPLTPGWDSGKWAWNEDAKASPVLQNEAVTRVRQWMTAARPPVMLHRDAPWGPAPIDGLPVDFTPEQWASYHQEWGDFQREMRLARSGNDTARGRAALMRFRQKAGMLRAAQTAGLVAAHVGRGYQVLVAVELVTTAADPVAEHLERLEIPVARIYGGGADLEAERLRFQRGDAHVVVFNTASAINLQANELMADGSRATSAQRIGIFHQPRYSGIQARQTIGRAHRDYQVCPWSLLYAAGTVEETAAKIMVDRLVVTSNSVDGDTGALHKIAALFGADWLPDSTLEP